ncbi:uncharacterized protein LOC125314103 [Rhodamnia argentea]|uniref:Uncharacterized protein LOC125314103 n=1 Tax=Rhodamnia argentea TaxID=178133 RepID=A0ABM3H4J2_9MYRT|nr:uncharacterized protein LOC125314103 [Rhodamnia argentea]
MPFGPTNAHVAFMDLMNRVSKEFLDRFIIVFIDYILVYSKSSEDHEQHPRIVLETTRMHRVFAKLNKCEFWLARVAFLGHVVSDEGIAVDPSKIKAIVGWPRPTIVTEIRNFLGPAGYYRQFVEKFSAIASPMIKLLKKDVKYEWTDKCERSFQELKHKATTAPVLTIPSRPGGFEIYSDASLGEKLNMRQRRWIKLLKDYDCEILYHPSKANKVADAPSRKSAIAQLRVNEWRLFEQVGDSDFKLEISRLSSLVDTLRIEPEVHTGIKTLRSTDPTIQKILQEDSAKRRVDFQVANDRILKFRGRLVVPVNESLREDILSEAHHSSYSIHPAGTKMYQNTKQHFWWNGMKADIAKHVAKCLTFRRVKVQDCKPGGLLRPLEIPEWK